MIKDSIIHGGDRTGYIEKWGKEPLDFSANISPLGMPEGVKNAIIEALKLADRYPDPLCRELKKAIAKKEGVPEEYCLCGNGAADLIFRAVMAVKPKKALITAPCFAEYEQALNTVDCNVNRYLLKEENGFQLDESFLEYIKPDVDMVFLCEPNNPTGVISDRELLIKILDKCSKSNAFLVMDECFNDFIDEPEKHTIKKEISKYPNLLILKAFTKIYAMAGVRLGYCLLSDNRLIDKMRRSGQPWAVSSLAQAAGIAALKEDDYVNTVRNLIAKERLWLKKEFKRIGLRYIDGKANYVLFKSEKELIKPLNERGIMMRSCKNYYGLDNTWYRTAIRTRDENEILINALKEVLT